MKDKIKKIIRDASVTGKENTHKPPSEIVSPVSYEKMTQELITYIEHLEGMVRECSSNVYIINEQLTREMEEHKKADIALKASEDKYRRLSEEYYNLLESLPDELLVLSNDRKILWANSVALNSCQNRKTLVNVKCQEFFNCGTTCEGCPVEIAFFSGETTKNIIVTLDNKFFDIKACPLKDEKEKIQSVIVISSNVTEKIKLQREAMKTSHLVSIGKLAAGVAHEINNPINGIINYSQILVDRMKEGSRECHIAGEIIKEGKRIAAIVSSLLSFSRGGAMAKTPVSIDEIFKSSFSLMESQLIRDGINIKLDVPVDLPMIVGQTIQIQQVFMNILSNARDALNKRYPDKHEDKIIDIRADVITSDNTPFTRVIFQDHGCGINENIIDQLMNPFFTTKPAGQGTGLGLSISYGIIKDHGGEIRIESVEGEFTKVIITLPVWDDGKYD